MDLFGKSYVFRSIGIHLFEIKMQMKIRISAFDKIQRR